jgi:hypothetical protein
MIYYVSREEKEKKNMKKQEEMVTITKSEYEDLLLSEAKLNALECWGVDNWGGYGDALREFYKDE